MPTQNRDRDFSIDNRPNAKKSVPFFKRLLSMFIFILLIGTAVVAVVLTVFLKDISGAIPSSQEILAHEPSLATVVYDRNDKVITHLFQENRTWVKLEDVSPWMVKAILAAEDSKFYEHSGIRPTAILRAAVVDFFHRGARQGGSTITQQLARNLFLTKEKTMARKAKEAILAIRLERIYSKDQLLEMYLNTIYMGHGAYGIDAAAKTYFSKRPANLAIDESAILAGLVAAPEKYSPFRDEDNSFARKSYVLRRMLDLDWISKADYDNNLNKKPALAKNRRARGSFTLKDAPYFVSYILFKQLLPNYGTELVYRGGMKVHTTIDIDLQRKAEQVVSSMSHEGALIALDPNTGEILAMVGGRDFDSSKFNRATQAYRQPGSAFKPIIYAAALEGGYRGVDHILDAPLSFANGWEPGNYSPKYEGEVTIVYALARSINTVAVRLAQITGISKVVDLARRMGITTPYLPEDLSLALGTASVTPMEMAAAYSSFANNGYRVEPYGIKRVESKTGEALEQNGPNLTSAMDVTTAATTRSLLQQVASWGTGAKANVSGYQTFGKTGTTNDWTDAWFAGGIPGLVVVVYVGNDNHKPLGGKTTGTVAAVPVWHEFVSYAASKLKLQNNFTLPPDAGVESVRVCRKTGFLATESCPAADILLPSGQAPTSKCPWHGGSLTAAKADGHAPQLILAPVDDESTHYKYALNSSQTGSENQPVSGDEGANAVQPDIDTSEVIPTQKAKEPEKVKVPVKNVNPYKNDPSQQSDMEAKYQELLKQYKISD